MGDVFEELGVALRGMANRSARRAAPPTERFRVTRPNPLAVVAERDDGLVLEAGDDDFMVNQAVATATLAVGDVVLVYEEPDGDYVALAVLS